MTWSDTFRCELDIDAAVTRLDGFVESGREDAAADPELGFRSRRRSPRVATLWISEDHSEIELVISLVPVADGTEVTVEVPSVRSRGLRVPLFVVRRLGLTATLLDDIRPVFTGEPTVVRQRWVPAPDEPDELQERYDEYEAAYAEQARHIEARYDEILHSDPALDAPGVRETLRARRWRTGAIALLASASLAVAVSSTLRGLDRDRRLHDHGVRTTAVVTQVPEGAEENLVVRFDAGQGEEFYNYYDPERDYVLGQRVRILALAGEDLIEIDGEIQYDDTTDDPAILGWIATVVLVPLTVRPAFRHRCARRRLAAGPVREIRVEAFHPSGRGARPSPRSGPGGASALALLAEDEPYDVVKLVRPWIRPRGGASEWDGPLHGRLFVDTADRRPRVAITTQGYPATIVRSRLPWRRRSWAWRIGRTT